MRVFSKWWICLELCRHIFWEGSESHQEKHKKHAVESWNFLLTHWAIQLSRCGMHRRGFSVPYPLRFAHFLIAWECLPRKRRRSLGDFWFLVFGGDVCWANFSVKKNDSESTRETSLRRTLGDPDNSELSSEGWTWTGGLVFPLGLLLRVKTYWNPEGGLNILVLSHWRSLNMKLSVILTQMPSWWYHACWLVFRFASIQQLQQMQFVAWNLQIAYSSDLHSWGIMEGMLNAGKLSTASGHSKPGDFVQSH